jgi:uroporphyrinogen-III synthase
MTGGRPVVAAFRPADDRIESAVALLESLGVEPLADPMLEPRPTGATPRADADYVVFTSKTGVELAAEAGFETGATVCAIGAATADSLRAHGYTVDVVPETYSSAGLVERLADEVGGARVEVARSDHGSATLLDGLEAAGAYRHETVLYELGRPAGAGESAAVAARGGLAGALFSSSLTVENFLAAAADRGLREAAVDGLADAVVGAIGEPTRATAEREGIPVDVVPETAGFETLARAVVDRL